MAATEAQRVELRKFPYRERIVGGEIVEVRWKSAFTRSLTAESHPFVYTMPIAGNATSSFESFVRQIETKFAQLGHQSK